MSEEEIKDLKKEIFYLKKKNYFLTGDKLRLHKQRIYSGTEFVQNYEIDCEMEDNLDRLKGLNYDLEEMESRNKEPIVCFTEDDAHELVRLGLVREDSDDPVLNSVYQLPAQPRIEHLRIEHNSYNSPSRICHCSIGKDHCDSFITYR